MSKFKKVCLVDFDLSFMGGLERVITDLANSFCDNYEVHMISLQQKFDKPYFDLDKRIKYMNIAKGEYRIRELIIKSFFPLIRYINKNKIDVVFVCGNYPIPVCLPVKMFTKAKFVYCDHGALENELEKKDITGFRRNAAAKFDKVVTLTEYNMNSYKKLFSTPDDKITYIHNWINDDLLKIDCDYNINSKTIMSAGRFCFEKKYDLLVEVGCKVFAKHPDWKWEIYGDGEEFDKIKSLIAEKQMENNIILMGKSTDMFNQYKGHAMLVLTSYREGLPLVLLEAKANRLPIVSFDIVTGPKEIITDGVDGFLIQNMDVDIMAEKICFLIENDVVRKQFSENYRNNMEKFSKETVKQNWLNLINNL